MSRSSCQFVATKHEDQCGQTKCDSTVINCYDLVCEVALLLLYVVESGQTEINVWMAQKQKTSIEHSRCVACEVTQSV